MIKLGSAGFNTEIGEFLQKNRIKCAEIEFVRSIYLRTDEQINTIKESALKHKIQLSIHAPYYINLASLDKEKIGASKRRILRCAKIGEEVGAKYVCFHAGFYHKRNPEEVYEIICSNIQDMQDQLNENNAKIKLAPELMGKHSQFGDTNEILRLAKDIKGLSMTIDFGHYLARNLGKVNYKELIKKLPQKFHAHFTGIQYGDKGEIRHIEADMFEFEKVLSELIKQKKEVSIINESARPIDDLIEMRKVLNKFQED